MGTMLVRARVRDHLEAVILAAATVVQELADSTRAAASMRSLPSPESVQRGMRLRALAQAQIVVSPHNDYYFRIVLPRETFTEMMAWLADDIDYCNFKGAVMEHEGPTDYEAMLHRVWSLHHRLQSDASDASAESEGANV